jgi:hypothetical protein
MQRREGKGFVRGMTLADYMRISTEPEWQELPSETPEEENQTPTFGRVSVPAQPLKEAPKPGLLPRKDRTLEPGLRGK